MSKNLGRLSSQLFELKTKKSMLNAEIKELNGVIRITEIKILDEMKEQGGVKFSNEAGTVYVSQQVVPKVVNWDLFYKYIKDTDYFHMLERRPSKLAFRESYEQGQQVPGVDPVVFDEVRTRKT
jgi:hypothetical protein